MKNVAHPCTIVVVAAVAAVVAGTVAASPVGCGIESGRGDVFDAGVVDDAGSEGTNLDCDGGACSNPDEAAAECASLVAQCCGATCTHSAGCKAATLLQQFEPDQCGAALTDSQTFPACELSNCDTLVTKVCGDDDTCDDAPGCAPAHELQTRANDPDATQDDVTAAQSECLQALEDEIVFAPCN